MIASAQEIPPSFDDFARTVGERVRRALVAAYGVEIGTEAAAEAMNYAWEHWEDVGAMPNGAGYLFRVGQSKSRPLLRWQRRTASFPSSYERAISGEGPESDQLLDLFAALNQLPIAQRTSVVLVRAHGYSYRDAADVLGVSVAAVTNHVHRGVRRLRTLMETT